MQRVPDVVAACNTNCPMELDTVGDPTFVSCNRAEEDAGNLLRHITDDCQTPKQNAVSLNITPMYPTYNKSLSIHGILLLGEILAYNKPANLDMACTTVNRKIEHSRNSCINTRQAVDGVNSLIQAFDLLDSDDSAAFMHKINLTAR